MRIAVVGCGQLSRMLAFAGLPMGISFSFINDTTDSAVPCVEGLGTIANWQAGNDGLALYEALGRPDCVTVEKEQLDITVLQALAEHCPVHPNIRSVEACQHRLNEKRLLESLSIPAASYTHGSSAADSCATLGLPLVVKSCGEGYDGKNQWILRAAAAVEAFDAQPPDGELIIEQFIPFECELSQVSARNAAGDIVHYPLAQNTHVNGILTESIAPAPDADESIVALARGNMEKLLVELDYVGVLAMECFLADGALLVNELAPRVHNSGHWSQMGAITSQFENHVRAVAGLPLGDTTPHGVAGMINLLGTQRVPIELQTGRSSVHWYNKEVRPGRKLGHVNFLEHSYPELESSMAAFRGLLEAAEV